MPEQEAMPPEVAAKVSQHTKAIRYTARRDGVPLPKAFNDYVSKNSLSGTERTAVRKKLGMMESVVKSDWRSDLIEVVKIEDASKGKVREIKDKEVSNKVKINPVQSEAFAEIGGQLLEITEQEMPGEDNKKDDDMKDKQLRHSRQMMRKRQMLDKQRLQMQKQGKLPMGHSEEVEFQAEGCECDDKMKDAPSIKDAKPQKKTNVKYDPDMKLMAPTIKKESHEPGKPAEKLGAVTAIPKQQQMDAKARLLAKAKAKRDARLKMKEETEDSLRDRRMERGGVDGNVDYRRSPKNANNSGKKKSSGMSAFEKVKADIIKKHGKGAIIEPKK
jgi:hypothetical protein